MHEPAIATLRQRGKSFFWAATLLPTAMRRETALLYAFCRHADDLADRLPPEQAIPQLEALREELYDGLWTGRAGDPKVQRMIDLIRRRHLPVKVAGELIDALIADCRGIAIDSPDAQVRYAYGVAGTVGLLISPLLGVVERAAEPFAVDLGIAMQLTNIARDVVEDAGRGRCYLPGGMDAGAILAGESQARGRAWEQVRATLELAERYYRSAEAGLRFIPPRARFAIATAACVYQGIGWRILARGPARYWQGRCYVSWAGKMGHSLRAAVVFLRGLGDSGRPHDAELHRPLKALAPDSDGRRL